MLASLPARPSASAGLCLHSFTHCGLPNGDILSLILPFIDWRTSIKGRNFLLISHLSPGLQFKWQRLVCSLSLSFGRKGLQVQACFVTARTACQLNLRALGPWGPGVYLLFDQC